MTDERHMYQWNDGDLPFTVMFQNNRIRFWCNWPEYLPELSGTADLGEELEVELDFEEEDEEALDMCNYHAEDAREAILWAVGEHYECAQSSSVKQQEKAAPPTEKALMELRRLSGLTWKQLAQLFEVSRRSVHFWSSGKAMSADNEEHLRRLLDVLQQVDRGNAQENRSALLQSCEGARPFDLLIQQEYGAAIALLGEGQPRKRQKLKGLAEEARDARRPASPETLVDARQDRVHREEGEVRVVRVIRVNESNEE